MKNLIYLPSRRGVLLLAAGLIALLPGCKKAADESAPVTPPIQQDASNPVAATESQAVLAALDKKEYDEVVAGLMRMRQAAGTPEQQAQFANFVDDVKMKLLDEAPTNPKAAQALAALRQMTGGR